LIVKHIIVVYANICLKEGTLQHIVLKINNILTFKDD